MATSQPPAFNALVVIGAWPDVTGFRLISRTLPKVHIRCWNGIWVFTRWHKSRSVLLMFLDAGGVGKSAKSCFFIDSHNLRWGYSLHRLEACNYGADHYGVWNPLSPLKVKKEFLGRQQQIGGLWEPHPRVARS